MHSHWMRRHRVLISEGFALVVRRRREAKRLSRAALAAKAGLHQTYVGLLERGERSPNLDTAQAIAKSLGVRLSRLIQQSERARQKSQRKRGGR
jgi:transcriptional regulator with XRE-family HTH domain